MSIQTAIENAQQKVENAYTAVQNKGGTMPSTQNLSNLPTAINSISTAGAVEELNVTPTTSAQTITPSAGVDGFNPVKVAAVTSAIDSDIKASNIKSGVNILGVNGSVVELNGETKSVSLTSSSGQTFTPSSGKNAITSITVTPNNQARTVTPTTSQQTLSVNSGYSGNGAITVNAVTSSIDSDIVAGNIKKNVNILGVTGTYEGEGANIDSLTIIPMTSAQTITANGGIDGYSPINVNAVTSAIDSNITPNKIRNGVKILDVTGTYGDELRYKVQSVGTGTAYITPDSDLYYAGEYGSNYNNYYTQFTYIDTNVIDCYGYANSFSLAQYLFYSTPSAYGNYYDIYTYSSGNSTLFLSNVKDFKGGIGKASNAGYWNSIWYIDANDDLYGMGFNSYGQQGSGNTSNVTTFTKRASGVYKIIPGYEQTGYINTNGDLYLCGRGYAGQQGSGNTNNVTTFTKRASGVIDAQISNGNASWYLDANGDLYGCGSNYAGQQGSGNTDNVMTFTKRASDVISFISSGSTTGYLDINNDLYITGNNNYGQQGSGNTDNVMTFTKKASGVISYVLTPNASWYLDTNGDLYGCGSAYSGQQGSGNTSNVTTFTKRASGDIKTISCGSDATWYSTSEDVYGCGSCSSGQQGNGINDWQQKVLTFTKRN